MLEGVHLVRGRANVGLYPSVVSDFAVGRDGLTDAVKNLGDGPLPVFNMSVRKREIAALPVAIRGQIPPFVRKSRARPGDAKERVVDPIFVDLDEDKELRRRGVDDLT